MSDVHRPLASWPRERTVSIRYPISVDSGLGQLRTEENHAEHVEQMIMQVLLTNPGERINRPDFGCGLRQMVFAPVGDLTATLAQVTVLQALEKWLGSVIRGDEVAVEAAGERLDIRIRYTLKARRERRILNLEVGV